MLPLLDICLLSFFMPLSTQLPPLLITPLL